MIRRRYSKVYRETWRNRCQAMPRLGPKEGGGPWENESVKELGHQID
jgi:hypothetical protein